MWFFTFKVLGVWGGRGLRKLNSREKKSKKKKGRFAQLWQHNRGTTSTIYQKKKRGENRVHHIVETVTTTVIGKATARKRAGNPHRTGINFLFLFCREVLTVSL